MKMTLSGGPAFSHLVVELAPQESILSESGAMVAMTSGVRLQARLNGNIFRALFRKILGGETLIINTFSNPTSRPQEVILTQPCPGDVRERVIQGGETLYLEPGSFLACTPGIRFGVRWAGLGSLFAGEGLFRLKVSGHGSVWVACFGHSVETELNSELIVDSGHLVAYPPSVGLGLSFFGGFFKSIFSGEGLVSRLKGKGKIVLQTRSLSGFTSWLNRRI